MGMNGTTLIKRPVDVVFAYVSDATNDVNWRTGLTGSGLKTDGPLGVGSVMLA